MGFSKKRTEKNKIKCKHGRIEAVANDPDQTYKCKNIDLYDFKTHAELGDAVGEGSGSWGWTSHGREFVSTTGLIKPPLHMSHVGFD